MFSAHATRRPTSRRPPILATALLGGMTLLLAACGDSADTPPAADAPRPGASPQNSIAEVAQIAGQFSALLRAVEAAGLSQTLHEDGPFTVFAPTDGAFSALPDGTLEQLMDDPETLSGILLYHVVPGTYTLEELREIASLETAQGSSLEISDSRGGLLIGGSNILTANVRASNGIIHVITDVLVP